MSSESHVLPIHLTDADFFSTIKKEGLMLTDFWAAWCAPCKVMAPIIEELTEKYKGKMKFAKVDVDANPVTSQQFGIMSIPTFLITDKGKVIDVLIGSMPKKIFAEKVGQYISEKAATL